MAEVMKPSTSELASFMATGVYHLGGSRVVFVDPLRILNAFYTRFAISPRAYYSRSFDRPPPSQEQDGAIHSGNTNKRKRKSKPKRKNSTTRELNDREQAAEKRHQVIRPLLVRAQEALLGAKDLVSLIPELIRGDELSGDVRSLDVDFIELGASWQAPLYEIALDGTYLGRRTNIIPAFGHFISNETNGEIQAEFLGNQYILPKRSCFYMSDLRQIHNLIPAHTDCGFNLIVIDPPWENGSVYQKVAYPTLPNRCFLYLPIKQLVHTEGALIVLWVTNREKLRRFAEEELFPAWGVTEIKCSYWLKVKPDGSLIGDLDLFHHRPYECFLLGYANTKMIDSEYKPKFRNDECPQVLISIPGVHSRKPPLGQLLSEYIPGPKPARCLELFARELLAGWTSWGNEPLHFQDKRSFVQKANLKK